MTIRADLSKKGWGAVRQGIPTGGEWNLQQQQLHTNVLETKALKLALLACHKQFQIKAIHFKIDNTTALSYLVKMGGTKNKYLIELAKEISPTPWDQNYCRIFSKVHEGGGRLTIKNLKRPFRVETPSTSMSENLSDQRKTRDGFLLLDCSTVHQIHTVREPMQCSKSGPISTLMLSHLF